MFSWPAWFSKNKLSRDSLCSKVHGHIDMVALWCVSLPLFVWLFFIFSWILWRNSEAWVFRFTETLSYSSHSCTHLLFIRVLSLRRQQKLVIFRCNAGFEKSRLGIASKFNAVETFSRCWPQKRNHEPLLGAPHQWTVNSIQVYGLLPFQVQGWVTSTIT